MNSNTSYTVEYKEQFYFALKIVAAIIGYFLIYLGFKNLFSSVPFITYAPILVYIPIIVLFLFLRLGLLVGYLRGNSIKINQNQFPDIHKIVTEQSSKLNIKKTPDVYILQSGGLLNAFATRFIGNDYIVLYSDIVEEAYNTSREALEFVIGHELGHIKRKHMLKSFLLFPSLIIPFLNTAYSRACEYTCDSIGASLQPKGALPGMLILTTGKSIWKKTNIDEFIKQEKSERGFWSWFAEIISTHPKMTKRIARLHEATKQFSPIQPKVFEAHTFKTKPEIKEDEEISDPNYSKYMPK